MPTDTWATRKRAEEEAMEWADEGLGKPRIKAPAPQPTDTLERDRKIGHIEKQTQNNPYQYLGHFAGNDVAEEGHNTGMKPKGPGTAHGVSTSMARAGYKLIPGSAGPLVGKANYHGRHYGDELDRMENEAREAGLKEPKAVTSRRNKRMEGASTTVMADMAFPAITVGAIKPKSRKTK